MIWGRFKDTSRSQFFLVLWVVWGTAFGWLPEQLMIDLKTNRIKERVSLVPAAAVIPALRVFTTIVVVKKFLALVKF